MTTRMEREALTAERVLARLRKKREKQVEALRLTELQIQRVHKKLELLPRTAFIKSKGGETK